MAEERPIEAPKRTLSIIMPAMNEEKNLPRAYEEVTAVMSGLPLDYEVIIIDNDSTDRTAVIGSELCARDSRWRYLKFTRNFTVEISITAGLRCASGDAALILFSDLQDPPSIIPEFLKKWEEGFDVVYGIVRARGGDPIWKSLSARLLYKIIHALSDVEIVPNATDFRIFSRRAIDAMNQLNERNRYSRGLAHWIGFKSAGIIYDRRPREAGRSKAPFLYLVTLAINAITCFTTQPLHLFTMAGAAMVVATSLLAGVFLAGLIFSFHVPGLNGTALLLLANMTIMLLGFGALGEYLGRAYIETKQRPLFLVERTINFRPGVLENDPRSLAAGR